MNADNTALDTSTEESISLGGTPEPETTEEIQAVPSLPPETPEKDDSIAKEAEELRELRAFRDAVAKDRDVQAIIQQRQEAIRQQETQRLHIQAKEQELLDKYAQAASKGDPNEIVLTLAREIRAQAKADADAEIQSRFASMVEPIRLKQQLMSSDQWSDLHPISDETVWLAGEMGRLGYSKPQIAEFVRTIGQKYAGVTQTTGETRQSRSRVSASGGLESPDSGGSGYMSDVPDKEWDKAIDNYWKKKGL